MKLLTKNAKTVKTERVTGYRVRVLHLAPAKLSGKEVCPGRSPGCTAGCLNTAGMGAFDTSQRARIARTRYYFADKPAFMIQLAGEISRARRRARRDGVKLAIRLNGTSDLDWEGIIRMFPDVQFYDYTKVWERMDAWMSYTRPPNEYLVWSLSEREDSTQRAMDVLRCGHSVAAVADARVLPSWMSGETLVDGDEHDLRFLDRGPCVVLLRPKGRAKRDKRGFVLR